MLIIDNREHALIELFKNETESQTENCDIVVEALDVGDVLIRLGRDYIYERKTLADLAASITDGRFREQKSRLMALQASGTFIGYIIEGAPAFDRPDLWINYKSCLSAILNCVYRDNLQVVTTERTGETVAFIKESYRRINALGLTAGENKKPSYIENLNVSLNCKRSQNIDGPETCLVLQLAQLPGISTTLAREIIDHVKTVGLGTATDGANGALSMRSFVEIMSRQDARQLLLQVKKIGKKKAESIVTFLGF